MAIPGVKVKLAPEGEYNANLPIWLAGQNNGSENGARFNAANLPFNGNGTNTTILPPYQLCLGDPNGTVVARGIGDFTLSNPGGWIYEATAEGNMSWSNQAFSLQGPPGGNGSNGGGGPVNQGIASNMSGIVIGNGNDLAGSGGMGIDASDLFGGTYFVFRNDVGGVAWKNEATGNYFIINQSGGYWGLGDSTIGPVIRISYDGSGLVFFTGNSTIIGDGTQFFLGDHTALPAPTFGSFAFNVANATITWFDGSVWREPSGSSSSSAMQFQGAWGSGTSYGNGTVVTHDAALWVCYNGPTVSGDQPLPNDGIWQTFEEAFYQALVAPGWYDSGTIDLGIMVIRNSPANFTYNSGGNGSFMLIDLDRRLRDLLDFVNAFDTRITVLEDWKATGAGVDVVVLIGDVGAGNGTMQISVDEGIFTDIVFPP